MSTFGRKDVAVTLFLLAAGLLLAQPAVAADRSDFCLECHAMAAGTVAPHPCFVPIAGVVSGNASGLPLDDGKMTCLTCHTGHGPEPDPAGAAKFFLRVDAPGLCGRCHMANGQWDRPHAYYADSIHGGARLALPAQDPAHDAFSDRCLLCHGDGERPAGIPNPGAAILASHSHPLAWYGERGGTDYARPADVDPAVRFVDGRVSCVTCHRLQGRSEYQLAKSRKRGELCLSCHDIGGATMTAAND